MAYIQYLEGTFTPTLVGGSTAGTTTYTAQNGNYIVIGSTIYLFGRVVITGATGTGNALFGGFPFSIKNVTGTSPLGNIGVDASGWTWPAGTTSVSLLGLPGTQTGLIICSGSATARANMQITNAAATFNFTLIHQVD